MTEHPTPHLSLVVPCYNEEDALPLTAQRLREELDQLVAAGKASAESKIYFVDDGSRDLTWMSIQSLARQSPSIRGIKLSRNFGHQYALYAGLMEAEGDAIISLDADLQDDVSVLGEMVDAYIAGNDIVYGVREDRAKDSLFKRWSAAAHYWISEKLGVETVRNHADYRLLSRRAIDFLSGFQETQLYLRGMIPLLGLPSTQVLYRREERHAGLSKYGLRNMLSLSVRGITSFSVAPLRAISAIGVIVFIVSLGLGSWALWAALFLPDTVPGWASTVIPIYFLGGLQLFALGVVGEYVGKIYIETKKRPLYQVETRCPDNK